jgi:hypothetical protein
VRVSEACLSLSYFPAPSNIARRQDDEMQGGQTPGEARYILRLDRIIAKDRILKSVCGGLGRLDY